MKNSLIKATTLSLMLGVIVSGNNCAIAMEFPENEIVKTYLTTRPLVRTVQELSESEPKLPTQSGVWVMIDLKLQTNGNTLKNVTSVKLVDTTSNPQHDYYACTYALYFNESIAEYSDPQLAPVVVFAK
jgi:hypothetical protein